MKTRTPRTKRDDPVTAYAKGVVSKSIIAGLMVRQACQRHLRDLEEQDARHLVWKPEEAQIAIDFFQQILCLPDELEDAAGSALADGDDEAQNAGKPFILQPWQQFLVGSLTGWYKTDGYTRFRMAFIETGKGSGKTPTAAGLLLYRLVVLPGVGKQSYIAATMKDQARLTFTDAVNMVQASPRLRQLLTVTVNSIAHLSSGSFIKPVSAEKKGLDGKRVDAAVVDEVQEQPSGVVVEKLRAGIKNRHNAQILLTTNSGYDKTSVCWELHEYTRQVLEGTIDNDAWFGYVCQLDPCDACFAKGVRAPQDKCPDCDHWHTEGPHWLKVNPNIGHSLSWEYLREQVKQALGMSMQQAGVMRLNFCIWTAAFVIWIPRDQWDACQVPAVSTSNPLRLPCVASLDLSVKYDLTVCVIALRHDDPKHRRPDTTEITGVDPETGEAYRRELNLDFTIELIPFFWLPEDTLHERVTKDRIPFDVWKKQGALEVTAGPVVDYNVIYDRLTRGVSGGLVKQFGVRLIGYDQYNATHIGNRLRDEAKLEVAELKQGKFLSEAAKTMHALVRAGRIRHGGNPVMGWCIANAQAKEDRFENIWLEKPSKIQRIDGATCAAGAIHMLMTLPKAKRSPYLTRGAYVVSADGITSAIPAPPA